jgi:hypothetical protein
MVLQVLQVLPDRTMPRWFCDPLSFQGQTSQPFEALAHLFPAAWSCHLHSSNVSAAETGTARRSDWQWAKRQRRLTVAAKTLPGHASLMHRSLSAGTRTEEWARVVPFQTDIANACHISVQRLTATHTVWLTDREAGLPWAGHDGGRRVCQASAYIK